jgi:predicted permease
MLTHLVQDLRVGLRVLLREKGFCALSVIVLALGICGVTTTFSVVNGVMLRGFSFPNSARMVSVSFIDPTSRNFFGQNGQVLPMDFEEVQPKQQSFELMTAYISGATVNVTNEGVPRRYTGAYVTDTFLRILGVSPSIGRDFRPEDNQPGAEKVALIGYGVWQRDFGGTPDIVGKALKINGTPATVIGVMPKGFAFPINDEWWVPLFREYPVRARSDPRGNNPSVLALLKRGVSLDQANAEMTTIARQLADAYPDTNKQFNTGKVEPLLKTYTPLPLRGTLLTMLAFCVGVLLIGCFNVMNMQFARATLRTRELAIRSSLGASRSRLMLQMLTESLLVTVVGAGLGVVLAWYFTDLLNATVRTFDFPPPSWMTFDIDRPVLVFSLAAMFAAAIASGLLPAWMASRANLATVLKEGGRGTSRGTRVVMRGLVVFQVVVTSILLIGSLLQMQSIRKQQTIDYGYDTDGVMTARMGLMDGDYPTNDARKLFFDRLVRELGVRPEFEGIALTNRFRMVFSGSGPVEIEGREYKDKKDRLNANFEQVTPGYFDVIGQALVEGRKFQDDDVDTKLPVAIANAAFARKYWGNESPLGRRFRALDSNSLQPGPWRTIVGVVETVRMLPPFNIPNVDETGFYVPFYSQPSGPTKADEGVSQFATLIVKPRRGMQAEALMNTMRQEVTKVDPNLPLYFVGTARRQIEGFVSQNRVVAIMFSVFGLVATVIAAVGIYGVMSFSVSQRTQEMGVRMALGADSRRILGMVLRQGSVLTLMGVALGVVITLGLVVAAGDNMQAVLFGVSPRDPLVYAAVAALVALISLAASLVPARRATRVDPMIALRAE